MQAKTFLTCLPLLALVSGCKTPAAPAEPLSAQEGRTVQLSLPLPTRYDGVTFEWVQTAQGDGPRVEILDPTESTASFLAPEARADYTLSFARLERRGIETETRPLLIRVFADDDPPTLRASGPATVAEGETAELRAEGIDPEGGALEYRWVQTEGPSTDLSDRGAPRPTFVAPATVEDTRLTFEVRVSDGVTESAPQSVTVAVESVNRPPTVSAGSDRSVMEGERVQLDGSVENREDELLDLRWRQLEGTRVVLDDETALQPTFQAPEPPGNRPAELVFEFTATDAGGLSADARVRLTIEPRNEPPEAAVGRAQTVREGDRVVLEGGGRDLEGAPLTYRWRQESGDPKVSLQDADTDQPWFVAPLVPDGLELGNLVFSLTVSDGVHESTPAETRVTLEPRVRPLRPLAPGEVAELFLEPREDFLAYFGETPLAPEGALDGWLGDVRTRTLRAVWPRSRETLTATLPGGAWRLQGTLSLPEATEGSSRLHGGALRFETGEDRALAVGLVLREGRRWLTVYEERRNARGVYELVPDSAKFLDRQPHRVVLELAVTWKDGKFELQWSEDATQLLLKLPRQLDLPGKPERLTLTVEGAEAIFGRLRLVGV